MQTNWQFNCVELCVQQQFLLLPQSSLESSQPPEWVSCASCQTPAVTFRDCFLFACVCNLISCNNIVLGSHITTGVTLTSCLKKNTLLIPVLDVWKISSLGRLAVYINLILLLEIKPLAFWKLDLPLPFWFPPKYWGLLFSQVLERIGGRSSVLRPGFQFSHLCCGEGVSGRSCQKCASLDSSSVLSFPHRSYWKLRELRKMKIWKYLCVCYLLKNILSKHRCVSKEKFEELVKQKKHKHLVLLEDLSIDCLVHVPWHCPDSHPHQCWGSFSLSNKN